MPEFRIKHITRYSYPSPVIDSANQVMLFPPTDEHQEVKNHDLVITGSPNVEIFTDYFGNKVGIFSVIKPHTELVIQSNIRVETAGTRYPLDNLPAEEQWTSLGISREEYPYLDFLMQETCELQDQIRSVSKEMIGIALTPYQAAMALSEFIFTNFEYKKGITDVETGVDDIWKLKAGVCQDFAHLLLVMLRLSGIPARYVSGYICPKGQELRGEGATHAWVEAYIPFHGWLGFDPTNNCIANDRHVRLAVGRNFSDCTPVKGTYKGSSEHKLEVAVTIENGNPESITPVAIPFFTYQVNNPGHPSGFF